MKLTLFILALSTSLLVTAQTKHEREVAITVEQLRLAMISGDKSQLEKLVSDQLSYGHSGGHIDDKKEFLDKLTTGKSDFVTIELTEQTIAISKKTAVVRHVLNTKTNDNNTPNEVHLRVLMIFQKRFGHWKLLARQAVKIT